MKFGGNKLKKILLLNEGNSNNLGDRAINESIKKILELNGYSVEFVDFLGIEETDIIVNELSKKSNIVVSILRKIVPDFIRTIRAHIKWINKELKIIKKYYLCEYDYLVIGGGQLILSNFYFPMAMYLWINKFSKKKNFKIYIVGVGAGIDFSFIDKQLYYKSLKKVDKLFIRDSKSIEILEKIFNIEAEFIPDAAFCLDLVYKREIIRERKVLVGIVDYEVYRLYNKDNKSEIKYIEEWIEYTKNYIEEGYNVELFYTTPEDYLQSLKLKNEYEKRYGYTLEINECKNLKELIRIIQSSEKLISARMHALIIGMVYGVKVIPYNISHKIETFSNEYINSDVSTKELQRKIRGKIEELFKKI